MNPLLIAAAVGGGLYLLSRGGSLPSLTGQPASVAWPPQPGQPGFVTLGGTPAGDNWSPKPGAASKGATLAGTAVGTLGAIGAGSAATASSAGGILGSGALASTTTLGAALPFIGIGIAAVGIVLSLIAKHHQQALANEGKVLNDALPRTLNAMVLVAQAALRGEITNTSQAKALLDQQVKDYYGEVRPILRGNWPYTDANWAANETYQDSWKAGQPGVQHTQEAKPPDPCNAACMIAHYFIERNAKVVLESVRAIFNGQHGVMVLPEVPRFTTQAGVPEIRMVF